MSQRIPAEPTTTAPTVTVTPTAEGTSPPPRSGRGVPELAKRTVSDIVRLAKLEIRLALEGVKGQAKQQGRLAAMGAAGGVFLLYGLLFVLAAAAAALAIVLPWWLSLLIVGLLLVVVGGILAAAAAKGFKNARVVPDKTKTQIKEDVQWLQNQTS